MSIDQNEESSRKNSFLPMSSDLADNSVFYNNSALWNSEDLQRVGTNRYMIQRRNTKIILELVVIRVIFFPWDSTPSQFVASIY